MPLPYYKRFPRDFLEGTVGMSLEEKGAYSVVIDLIFLRDGRLEADARYIAGQLGCSVRKWSSLLAALVEKGKLIHENGIISNLRADYLVEEQRKYQDKQAENGSAPKKINNLPKPPLKPKANQSDTEIERISEATLPHPDHDPGREVDEKIKPERSAPVRQADVDRIWAEAPKMARERSSRADVCKALKAAVGRGATVDQISAAVLRYHGSPQATKEECRAMRGLHRSIQEDRWKDWALQIIAIDNAGEPMSPEQFAEWRRKING